MNNYAAHELLCQAKADHLYSPLVPQLMQTPKGLFFGRCGIFRFTFAAEFTLRTVLPFRRLTPGELIDQPRKVQQIRHPEQRSMLAQDDLRIRSDQIRPLLRNRADRSIIYLQQQTPSIRVAPLPNTSELFATKWVERMRDAHKTRRCDRSTCILDRVISACPREDSFGGRKQRGRPNR